jgi:ketosteroid isomerase-like protein
VSWSASAATPSSGRSRHEPKRSERASARRSCGRGRRVGASHQPPEDVGYILATFFETGRRPLAAGQTAAYTRKHKRGGGAILRSVSAENVEIVRRWVAAVGGSADLVRAAIDELWEEDADYYPVRKWPETRPCHGREDVKRFFVQGLGEAFAESDWEVRLLIPVSDDRVLADVTLRAEGRGSGINLEGDVYWCFWVRHGRFFHVEDHLTLSGALHALGLEGETLEAAGLRAPTNLEFVRSLFADWERGDFSSSEWAHPEIEYVHADGPAPGNWKGLAGLAEGWRVWLSAWEELRSEVEEYRELDEERVLVLYTFSGRGKTSGLDLGQLGAKGSLLFHVREGKVTRLVMYLNRERALADVGLTSETEAPRP